MDLGAILSGALADARRETERRRLEHVLAQQELKIGLACARWIAAERGIGEVEAWDGLTHTPNEMLGLLKTPGGWAALREHVTLRLGVEPGPRCMPGIH